jgi:hypothetical protein
MNGNQEDRYLREELGNAAGNFDTIQVGHLEIQQNHVGRIRLNPFQGLRTGWNLIADSPCTLLLEQRSQEISNRRIVIGHKNSHQTKPSLLF